MADITLTIAGQVVTLKPNSDSAWDGEVVPGVNATLFKPAGENVALMSDASSSYDGYALCLWGSWGQLAGAYGATPEGAASALNGKLELLRPLFEAWRVRELMKGQASA